MWMLTWKFWIRICATGILRDKLCFWDPTYSEISKFCHNSVFFRHVHVKPCAKSAARNNFEWILIQRPALAGRLSQCRTVTRVLQLNMMLQARSSNQGGDYNCREKRSQASYNLRLSKQLDYKRTNTTNIQWSDIRMRYWGTWPIIFWLACGSSTFCEHNLHQKKTCRQKLINAL